MKFSKKILTFIITTALAITMSMPAFASSLDTSSAMTLEGLDFDSKIQFIKDTYNYTNEHMGEYIKIGPNNYNYDYAGAGDAYVDASGAVVYMEYNADSYDDYASVECYYLNPALGKTVPGNSYGEVYIENLGLFIFGVDNAGGEHRIYLDNAKILRYIGPDGIVQDFPEGLDMREFPEVGGMAPYSMLSICFPGWWMAYGA